MLDGCSVKYLFGLYLFLAAVLSTKRRKKGVSRKYIDSTDDVKWSSVWFLDYLRIVFVTQQDPSGVTDLMIALRDRFDESKTHVHWSRLALEHISVRDFRRLLKAYGSKGVDKYGRGALDSAVASGEGRFIDAVLQHESQTTVKNGVAERTKSDRFLRWREASKEFVRYMHSVCGLSKTRDCLSTLKQTLVSYLSSEKSKLGGNLYSADILGAVWWSDDVLPDSSGWLSKVPGMGGSPLNAKQEVWESLKRKCEDILDYQTLHESQCDWQWFKSSLLTHPLWLEQMIDESAGMDGVGGSPDLSSVKSTTSSTSSWTSRTLQTLARATSGPSSLGSGVGSSRAMMAAGGRGEDSKTAEESSAVVGPMGLRRRKTESFLRHRIRFDWLTDLVRRENSQEKGMEIASEMGRLIEQAGPEEWSKLLGFDVDCTWVSHLRQDSFEGGPKANWSASQLAWILLNNSSFAMDPFKQCDLHSFVTELTTSAQYLSIEFERVMTDRLKRFGLVQVGPVKLASRIRNKTESDYSDRKRGFRWPYSAHVLDVLRCSVTVNSIDEMNAALSAFSEDCKLDEIAKIVRCKNGFSDYGTDEIPAKYSDVKLNVLFSFRGRSVVGEVQFLLQCMLDGKKKGHELYEIERSVQLMDGALKHFQTRNSWKHRLLACAADSKTLVPVLSEYPHIFTVEHLTEPLIRNEEAGSRSIGISAITLIAKNMRRWKTQCEERLVLALLHSDGVSAESLATILEHNSYPKWWHPMMESLKCADLWVRVLLPTDEMKRAVVSKAFIADNVLLVYLLKRDLAEDQYLSTDIIRMFEPSAHSADFWRQNSVEYIVVRRRVLWAVCMCVLCLQFLLDSCVDYGAWHSAQLLSEVMPPAVVRAWREGNEDLQKTIADEKAEFEQLLKQLRVWDEFQTILRESADASVSSAVMMSSSLSSSVSSSTGESSSADAIWGRVRGMAKKKKSGVSIKRVLVEKPELLDRLLSCLEEVERAKYWRNCSAMDVYCLFAHF